MLLCILYIYAFIINDIFSKVTIMEHFTNNNFEDSNLGSQNTETETNDTNTSNSFENPKI